MVVGSLLGEGMINHRQRSGHHTRDIAWNSLVPNLSGGACRSVQVETTGAVGAGGTVKVTISCSVDYRHALLLGIPGEKCLSATAEEPVDTVIHSGRR